MEQDWIQLGTLLSSAHAQLTHLWDSDDDVGLFHRRVVSIYGGFSDARCFEKPLEQKKANTMSWFLSQKGNP